MLECCSSYNVLEAKFGCNLNVVDIITAEPNFSPNQIFKLYPTDEEDCYFIQVQNSGKFFDVAGYVTNPGTILI